MTNFATASFLTVKTAAGAVLYRWQSYQPGSAIDGHSFYPFSTGEMVEAGSGAADSLQIEFPMTSEAFGLLRNGLPMRYLIEAALYFFEPTADGLMPVTKTLAAAFQGEVIGGSATESNVVVEIGSRLDAVEAHVPVRIFTAALVGTPPKL